MQFTDAPAFHQRLAELAASVGIRRVGVASLDQDEALGHLARWLDEDFHGEMDWLKRGAALRAELSQLQPGAKRIVMGVCDYTPPADDQSLLDAPELAYISRYALGRDYHKLLRKRMKKLAEAMGLAQQGYRVFADSAPVLEKHFAEQAGLGWLGKHTLLLSRDGGSWTFLTGFLTDAELPITEAQETPRCGSCTACIDICPTQAIVAPYRLDARRCISYHTIEMDAPIPEEFREPMGNRVFGCDDCQWVCPWNRYAKTRDPEFEPRHELDRIPLLSLWAWDEAEFEARTQGMAIRRAGYLKFRSNLAIALGNQAFSPEIVAALEAETSDNSRLRAHRDWALAQQRKKCSR